jgi:hypothetical protein
MKKVIQTGLTFKAQHGLNIRATQVGVQQNDPPASSGDLYGCIDGKTGLPYPSLTASHDENLWCRSRDASFFCQMHETERTSLGANNWSIFLIHRTLSYTGIFINSHKHD